MAKIKGQNLRITIGGKYIAFATSCTLHVAADIEESSTKDSTGGWQEQEITGMNWDISCDAMYSVDEDASGVNGVDALDLILAGQPVEVEFEKTSGEQNRVKDTKAATYKGTAIVNDISIQAQNQQNTTYTLQAQGTGALSKVAATA